MSTWRAHAALAGAALCIAGCDGAWTSLTDRNPNPGGKAFASGGDPFDDHEPPSANSAPHGPGGGAATSVYVCHRAGQSGATMTLLLPPHLVAAHVAHGDKLGRCEQSLCSQKDFDGDGVNNCLDACLDTLPGQTVDERGCPVVVLRVDAGPDWSVTAGDLVAVEATVEVVQGPASPDNMVWSWEQVAGTPAAYQASGASFVLETAGQGGTLTFRVTASDDGGTASANDAFVVEVQPVSMVHLAAGKWHNAALFSNGRLRTWGWGSDGQLGNGTLNDSVADVDANAQHTVVVREDGTAWTFGSDALNNSAAPVQVPGASDVAMVAAMARGAFLLQSTGELLGFTAPGGECVLGGIPSVDGAGATMAITVAIAPPGLVEIATGGAHVVALDANGTAWVWGSRFGCSPRAVLTDVTAIAAGDTDLCLFVRSDGTAWGLGYNLHGQLGNGTTLSNYTTPRLVSGLTDVVQVAAGERHSLFVTGDGSLFSAGWNRYCQLGLEDEPTPADPQFGTAVLSPVQVDLADVVLVAGGDLHTVAVTGDGKVWGWGLNNVGQLHAGTLSVLPGTVCAPMEIELE